jgi:hypothetical protein
MIAKALSSLSQLPCGADSRSNFEVYQRALPEQHVVL